MICKNCNSNIEGKFCRTCGQKASTERITFRYLLNEISNSIFQINRGFFFTVKELLIRPGHAIRDFIHGKRVSHYKPIGFLLVTATIYVFTIHLLETSTYIDSMLSGAKEAMLEKSETSTDSKFLNWVELNQAYIPLLLIPLFATASFLAFFKSGYNYFEHIVLYIYITGEKMLMYLLCGFLVKDVDTVMSIITIISPLYTFWVYVQFFNEKKKARVLFLIFLKYFLFVALLFTLATVLAAVIAIIT